MDLIRLLSPTDLAAPQRKELLPGCPWSHRWQDRVLHTSHLLGLSTHLRLTKVSLLEIFFCLTALLQLVKVYEQICMLSVSNPFALYSVFLHVLPHQSHRETLIHSTILCTCHWEVTYKDNRLQFSSRVVSYPTDSQDEVPLPCFSSPAKRTKPLPLPTHHPL